MFKYLFLFTILISQNVKSQIFFLPKQSYTSIDTIQKLESKRQGGSVLYKNLFENQQTQFIFKSSEPVLPPLAVKYLLDQKHLLNQITYLWDSNYFNGNSFQLSDEHLQKSMIDKYDSLINELYLKFGNYTTMGAMEPLSQIDALFGLYRTDTWETDSLKINSFIQLCNYTKTTATETAFPICKIEIIFEFKYNENTSLKLEDLSANFNSFLQILKDKEYENAKNLFSNKIKNTITEEYLKEFRNQINFKNTYEIYKNSTQLMADGSENYILQFKNTKELNANPLQYMAVVFDKKGKILGINSVNLID